MRKGIRLALGLLLILMICLLAWAYWAARQTPSWYAEAIAEKDAAAHKKAADQMEQRMAELVSGFHTTGRWKVLFSEEQINGWLASALESKHPDLLPPGFIQPRVKIESDGITGACRVERGSVSGVVSIKVDVYLTKQGDVAMRVRRARLGSLPWPLGKITEAVSDAARKNNFPLTWSQTDSDPVALVRIMPVENGKQTHLESLQLEKGKLYVAGVTEQIAP